ncbi:MAG: TonB-dependent receptor, partial [Gemmatimonadota bacterium]
GDPVAGAVVEAVAEDGSIAARGETSDQGAYRLAGLGPGSYTLVVTSVGYQVREIEDVRVVAGSTTLQAVALTTAAFELNPITVTASRRQEKVLEAPATVNVVDAQRVRERPAFTMSDHLRGQPGVDVATTGLMQSNVVTRGFNNVFSGSLLMLTDNRIASVPSLRVNAGFLVPTANEDIERIEVVLGPGAALYGPNSANGVMHVVTASPFDSEGTEVQFTSGRRAGVDADRNPDVDLGAAEDERSILQGSIRHAGTIGDDWGYKLSGQLMRGGDWHHYDPLEDSTRVRALATGADPDELLIARRDFAVERYAADARLDYRPDDATELVLSTGTTLAGSAIELTGLGAAQADDWRYDYYQLRFHRDDLFAQLFLNTSDAGDTYLLRTGQPIVDESAMFVGQVQYSTVLGDDQVFTYGIDFQHTDPRTGGTITGRNETDDRITEWGGYLHSETSLSTDLDLVGAIRLDTHDRLPDPVVSPRAAIVYHPVETHNVRVTYNRAFSTPTTNNLFLDIVAADMDPLPYQVRALGVPTDGLEFRGGCGGVADGYCMRSPFASDPSAFVASEATQFWDEIMALATPLLQAGGIPVDLTAIPSPSPDEVGSVLKVLNTTDESWEPTSPEGIRDVDAIRPTINNTVEIGYKGIVGERLLVTADAWWERRSDFIGPLIVETPQIFFDEDDLTAYLTNFLPEGQARPAARNIANRIPAGTINPDHEMVDPTDLIVTYRNFGEVDLYGGDLGAEFLVNDNLSLNGSLSLVSRDFFSRAEVGGLSPVALNAPEWKYSLGVRHRSSEPGVTAEMRVRSQAGFPMNSGVFIGDVEGYTVVDANLGYRLPLAADVTLTVSARNLFNSIHREFFGAPELGRIVLTRLQYRF